MCYFGHFIRTDGRQKPVTEEMSMVLLYWHILNMKKANMFET